MTNPRKIVVVVTALAIAAAIAYCPWRFTYSGGTMSIDRLEGYAFIWSDCRNARPDVALIAIEIFGILALGVAAFIVTGILVQSRDSMQHDEKP